VESCVTLDGFPVHISLGIDQKSCNLQVTFVASDHQTCVTMAISHFNICKENSSNHLSQKNWALMGKLAIEKNLVKSLGSK